MTLDQWVNWKKLGKPDCESGQAYVYFLPREATAKTHALKRLKNPKRVGRFRSEIRNMKMLAAAGDPVVPIVDENASSSGDPWHYYVMPYYSSGNLHDAVNNVGSAFHGPEAALFNFVKIAKALNAIHAKGVYHRDIKPENIFVDGDTLLFADFGLCFASDDLRQTETMEQVGSRHWMAPEMLGGRLDVNDEAVDYYSMGKLLYFMLTGTILRGIGPYNREHFTNIDHEQASLIGLCAQSLVAFDPEQRRQAWAAVITTLSAIMDKKLPSEPKPVQQSLSSEILIRYQHMAASGQQRATKERQWHKFAEELKRCIHDQWLVHPDVVTLREQVEQNGGLEFNHSLSVAESEWSVTTRGIICERDSGHSAMMRQLKDLVTLPAVPIAVAAVAPPPENFAEIRLLVGVGARYPDTPGSYCLPQLSPDGVWEAIGSVDDPELLRRALELAELSGQLWAQVTRELVERCVTSDFTG